MNKSKNDKQEQLILEILKMVGSSKNIKDVYHCATRMRFTLFDRNIVYLEEIKKINGIKGAIYANGELQIIIGQQVSVLTTLLKNKIIDQIEKPNNNLDGFELKKPIQINQNISIWRKFLKAVSGVFGPLIPFLIGVGLIMAFQQLLIRTGLATDPTKEGLVLGNDYNVFDLVLNVIAQTGFKLMGVVAIWSTVRYLGGKTPIAIALGLIMISPILPADGLKMFSIGQLDIYAKPFYSTILVFIIMGIIIAQCQKLMNNHFNPIANFILNPFLTLLIGGLLAFFVFGPIMGFVEKWMLDAFNWFMTLPFGIGTMIVGLTWQPLVVLGVHNILFFAAVTDLTTNGNPSIFLAAAFAAAWAQLGATIGVALRAKKTIDKSTAISAALPGIISGPTESVIYAVNLPKVVPFITGVIAGGIGGWLVGMLGLTLDNLAGLGGIVGFLAYTDDLWQALVIDLGSFALGIIITFIIYSEQKTEKQLVNKITKLLNKNQFLSGDIDYKVQELYKLIKSFKWKFWNKKSKADLIEFVIQNKKELISLDPSLSIIIDKIINQGDANLFSTKKVIQNIKSDRQQKLVNIHIELKKIEKDLKIIQPETKIQANTLAKKQNIEYKLNKIFTKQEEKNANLFTKGQKLILTENLFKVEKGNDLIKQSKENDSKYLNKEKELQEKLQLNKLKLENNNQQLKDKLDVFYKQISKCIIKIEKIKNNDLSTFEENYQLAIYQTLIKKETFVMNKGK